MRLSNAAIVSVALAGIPFTAQATLLEGKTITTAFYFPDQSTIGFGGVPVDSVVGAGIEIAASPQGFPITSIDFADTSITLHFTTTLSGTVAPFNGWRFYDASNNIAPFQNVTLTTSLPGWSVTSDADNIWLNGAGSQYTVGSTLRIDIVPESSTYAFVLFGLAGLLFKRRFFS